MVGVADHAEEGVIMNGLCKMCGFESDPIRNGLCEDCIESLYDEHESEMFLFFALYPPNEWDDTRCKKPLVELWADAERERFANDFGDTRHYLKQYALEDKWCLTDWMETVGMI